MGQSISLHIIQTTGTANDNHHFSVSSINKHDCHSSSSAMCRSAGRGCRSVAASRRSIPWSLAVISLATTIVLAQSQPQPSVCLRYAHSSTVGASQSNTAPNSTLYIYGGDAKTSIGQTSSTRTNALVSLDLTTSWSISNPPLSLVKPANDDNYSPPKTSLGGLFSNADGTSLFYYGGYYSDNPTVAPDAVKLYEYTVASSSWSTVDTTGATVERSSGGAAAVTPASANASSSFWYFGGHLDSYTTEGWSNQIPRLYLDSIVEYDAAGRSWTNHSTSSGSGQASANSTTETTPLLRGDSTLTYVPGLGTNGAGILVNIGGGNLNQLVDNNLLDVYDLGTDSWARQATLGYTMSPRVSHCAVRGSAKVNGELQHLIITMGGQASNRTTQMSEGRSNDVYVLMLPSFTWHFMGQLPSAPPGRAGHTCTLVGSQLIVVGGYISDDVICEQPGVFVYDVSQSKWVTEYKPNTVFTIPDTPEIVAVTGGRGTGSSTSGSGYAFGTGANDADTSSQFKTSGNGTGGGQTQSGGNGGGGGSNVGAIAGGVVGGVLGGLLLAALAFWLYRRRQRKNDAAAGSTSVNNGEKAGLSGSSPSSGSPGTRVSEQDPYDQDFADDDVDDQTAGYTAQFSSRLVPKRSLRVVNV